MNFIDLFCGCGGLSEGFLNEGYKPIILSDIDSYSMDTTKNRLFDKKYSESEVNQICHTLDLSKKKSISFISQLVSEDIDTIMAGIPCQAYSTVGRAQDKNSMRNDYRNYLYLSLMKYVELIKPKTVIIENVSGLLSAKPNKRTKVIDDIFKKLNDLGYSTYNDRETILLNSVNYGTPQERKRVIIFGVKKALGIKPEKFFNNLKKTHYSFYDDAYKNPLKKYHTVKEAEMDTC